MTTAAKAKVGTFSTPEASKLTGIPKLTLAKWARAGVVSPTLSLGAGRGCGSRWTLRDLIGLRTIRQLRNQGVSLQKVRRLNVVLTEIKSKRTELEALAASRLVVLPDLTVALKTRAECIDLISGQHLLGNMIFVDMEACVHEVTRLASLRDREIISHNPLRNQAPPNRKQAVKWQQI